MQHNESNAGAVGWLPRLLVALPSAIVGYSLFTAIARSWPWLALLVAIGMLSGATAALPWQRAPRTSAVVAGAAAGAAVATIAWIA
jgi:hypothetical protein